MPSLGTLANSLKTGLNQRLNDASLLELDSDGSPLTRGPDEDVGLSSELPFQYWPETLTDTKATNYQQKEIVGGSLPLYQWVNGGERLITFMAVFTTDVDLIDGSLPAGVANRSIAATRNSVTGGSGIGNPTQTNPIVDRLNQAGVQRRNADIRAAVAWLRRFLYPTYSNAAGSTTPVLSNKPLTRAPPKLKLKMPNSGIGLAGADTVDVDAVRCIMTQCDVTYEQWFPSGLPRIATVSLAFAEVPQIGGNIIFPDRRGMAEATEAGSSKTTGYTFVVRKRRSNG